MFDTGQYRLVIRRPLKTAEPRTSLPAGVFFPVAFRAWDGSEGDEGPKAAISTWYYLRLEPPASNRRFIIPPLVALMLAAEIGLARGPGGGSRAA